MIFQIFLLILMTYILWSRWKKRGMIKLWNQLRNNYKTLPLIGHAYMFVGSDEDRMKMFQKLGIEAYETGGLLSLWQGSKLYLNVSDPAIAELVLKKCLEKDDVLKCSRILTGNGSVFAPVSLWRPRRKFLTPTFSPKNLLQFAEIFSQQSAILAEQLRPQAGRGTFSIWKYITSYSLDSVCESTLGVKMNSQIEPTQSFHKAFEEVCKIDAARICQPWLHSETLFKMMPCYKVHFEGRTMICGLIDRVIKAKRQSLKEEKAARNNRAESEQSTEIKPKTFLELLIESSGGERGFSDLELQEETLVLVLAGTDTSAVGSSFTALMLARHPDVQEKVFQEIQEIFGDTDRPIAVEDLPRLTYLDAAIRETMRLYPPVPVIVRKVTKDLTLPSGLTLVEDCGVVVNIWAIHRNPKYWGDDAMEYKPERFLDSPLTHPAAFMPFSHGPRACVGYKYAMMSMKTAVATLVRRYRIYPAEDASLDAPLRVKFDVMMKHVDDFELQLEMRN